MIMFKRVVSLVLTISVLLLTLVSVNLTASASLLPLEEIKAHLVLDGYSSSQLSQMNIDDVISMLEDSDGYSVSIPDGATTAWRYDKDELDGLEVYEAYQLYSDETIDLSQPEGTENFELELIIGSNGQLNPDNVRYIIKVYLINVYQEEFSFSIYTTDEDGNKVEVSPTHTEVARFEQDTIVDANGESLLGYGYAYSVPEGEYSGIFVGMSSKLEERPDIDVVIYDLANYDSYNNSFGDSITYDIIDRYQYDSYGYPLGTIATGVMGANLLVVYYLDGQPLDFEYVVVAVSGGLVSVEGGLFAHDGANVIYEAKQNANLSTAVATWEYVLKENYAVEDEYDLNLYVHNTGVDLSSYVEKAVVGHFDSAASAESETDIKNQLFGSGYRTDYSGEGVPFTLFFREGVMQNGNVYKLIVKAVAYDDIWYDFTDKPIVGQQDPWFRVVGVGDADGNLFEDIYVVENGKSINMDTYYGYGYQVVFINDADADLSALTPQFWYANTERVYAVSSDTGELVDKETLHIRDFSSVNQQYAGVIVDNGKENDKNYWITFKKLNNDGAELFVYGPDEREVILDEYFEYKHDILIANVGNQPLEDISVELVGAKNVKLDPYWTVGDYNNELAAFSTSIDAEYGELPNMAKIRLISDGNGEVEGTLIIRAKGQEPVMITLNGTAQTPDVITESVEDAVKYVPYSQIIATNNIHDWLDTEFYIESGELPAGLTLNKHTGEIYGVATVPANDEEKVIYDFTVRVDYLIDGNDGYFESAYKSYSLTVKSNTNENVYNSSDDSYGIKQHIGIQSGDYEYVLELFEDTIFTSHGEYDNFVGLWINGQKLVEGVDYTYIEGSTKITIIRQTLLNKGIANKMNTIAAEFRENGGDLNSELKCTAQNFILNVDNSVSKVMGYINGLPANITLDDKVDVEFARAEYEALNEVQKARVTNLDVLIAAEKTIAELEQKLEESKPKPPVEEPEYDVIYDISEDLGVVIEENTAFPADTIVKVTEVASSDIKDAITKNFEKYVGYDFSATNNGKFINPSIKLKVNFEIPDGFSSNVMICSVSPDGTVEELPKIINKSDNTVSVDMSRMDVYILVDLDSQIINVDNSGNGDVSGNNKLDALDYILLKRAYFGTFTLDERAHKAGDINGNQKIDSLDYILLKRAYFGTYVIKSKLKQG